MFGKYRAIFTSRWKALIWAVGVCLTAYCTVPSSEQSEVAPDKVQPRHVNPWALHGQGQP